MRVNHGVHSLRRAGWAVAAALLLAFALPACGRTDPFVGTWAIAKGERPLAVIAKGDRVGVYLVTMSSASGRAQWRFSRQGQAIVATRRYSGPLGTVTRTFRFTPTSDGRLTYFEGEHGSTLARVELERASSAASQPSSDAVDP